jgi:hypothetical protein
MLYGEAEVLRVSVHKTGPRGRLFSVLCEFRFMIANDPEAAMPLPIVKVSGRDREERR